jgi:hypothetical protein
MTLEACIEGLMRTKKTIKKNYRLFLSDFQAKKKEKEEGRDGKVEFLRVEKEKKTRKFVVN